MKKWIALFALLLLTGCGSTKKDTFLGTWKTSYTVAGVGEVTESYTFKEENKCVRTITTTVDMNTDCTYEFNEDKTQIKIDWEDKIGEAKFETYEKVDDDTIKIGANVYKRGTTKNEK